MGEPLKTPRTPTLDLHNIFWIPKTASLKEIGKAYKSLVSKKHSDKSSRKDKISEEAETPSDLELSRNVDDNLSSLPSVVSRNNASRRSKTPTPTRSYMSRNPSRRSKTPNPLSRSESRSFASDTEASLPRNMSRRRGTSISESTSSAAASLSRDMSRVRQCVAEPQTPDHAPSPSKDFGSRFSDNDIPAASLSRNISRRSTTPIIFSQTTIRRKPPPMEKKLECTLEDLCFGCVKKIKITRDVIKPPGVILQEDEVLKIEVKPGWRTGTKIALEEKGNEEPGYLPADIIFSIDEKEHPLFSRDGNNLEICVEIPLVNALTGCSLPVPLLGGETMNVSFENIVIYPGYVKVIQGKGMPDPQQNGKRGDLHIKFLISFPTELSDEQREEAVSILRECDR
ncbi:DnaJ-like subfamily B member 13 [Senna tora]|uniref:DnaJ-like subfamily B member 13 n=1 Tax=Senna tora TaxID=362788 RepID=A0A834SHF6_9FABA|nr:DnaJ-like subfamily B member 13 [Senna tora]